MRDNEKFFHAREGKKAFPEPFATSGDRVALTVVVPAFNEEKRIHLCLQPCLDHLLARQEKNKDFSFEVVVVLDGWYVVGVEAFMTLSSTDKTGLVVEGWVSRYPDHIRVLDLVTNRGKGGAVRKVCTRISSCCCTRISYQPRE